VPPAESATVRDGQRVRDASSSRLDSLPLVSKVAGMLRGLRFNVASQKLEEAPDQTGNDVNDNEKQFEDDDLPLPVEAGYAIPSTSAEEDGSAKKKRGSGKAKKTGRKEKDGGEKHHRMEEENSTDTDEDLTGKTARKLTKQLTEKGKNFAQYTPPTRRNCFVASASAV